jgi:hypothetical protein
MNQAVCTAKASFATVTKMLLKGIKEDQGLLTPRAFRKWHARRELLSESMNQGNLVRTEWGIGILGCKLSEATRAQTDPKCRNILYA